MYYKLGQACDTNWGSFVLLKIRANIVTVGAPLLLQIGASVVTDWGSYSKLEQPFLQNRAAVTKWDKICYKLGHNNNTIVTK